MYNTHTHHFRKCTVHSLRLMLDSRDCPILSPWPFLLPLLLLPLHKHIPIRKCICVDFTRSHAYSIYMHKHSLYFLSSECSYFPLIYTFYFWPWKEKCIKHGYIYEILFKSAHSCSLCFSLSSCWWFLFISLFFEVKPLSTFIQRDERKWISTHYTVNYNKVKWVRYLGFGDSVALFFQIEIKVWQRKKEVSKNKKVFLLILYPAILFI